MAAVADRRVSFSAEFHDQRMRSGTDILKEQLLEELRDEMSIALLSALQDAAMACAHICVERISKVEKEFAVKPETDGSCNSRRTSFYEMWSQSRRSTNTNFDGDDLKMERADTINLQDDNDTTPKSASLDDMYDFNFTDSALASKKRSVTVDDKIESVTVDDKIESFAIGGDDALETPPSKEDESTQSRTPTKTDDVASSLAARKAANAANRQSRVSTGSSASGKLARASSRISAAFGDEPVVDEPVVKTTPGKLEIKGPWANETKESTWSKDSDVPNVEAATSEQIPVEVEGGSNLEDSLEITAPEASLQTSLEGQSIAGAETGSNERMAPRRSVTSVSEQGIQGEFSAAEIAGEQEINEVIDEEFTSVMAKWDSRKRGSTLGSDSAVEEVLGTPFDRKPSWENLANAETSGAATDSVEPSETKYLAQLDEFAPPEEPEVAPKIAMPYGQDVPSPLAAIDSVEPSETKDLVQLDEPAPPDVSEDSEAQPKVAMPYISQAPPEEPDVAPKVAMPYGQVVDIDSVKSSETKNLVQLDEPAPMDVSEDSEVQPTVAMPYISHLSSEEPKVATPDLFLPPPRTESGTNQVKTLGEFVNSVGSARAADLAELCDGLSIDSRKKLVDSLVTDEAKVDSTACPEDKVEDISSHPAEVAISGTRQFLPIVVFFSALIMLGLALWSSPQQYDVVVEVPSIFKALADNRLNIRTSSSTLKMTRQDVSVIGVLGYTSEGVSSTVKNLRSLTAGHTWIFVTAVLPASRSASHAEQHLKWEDKSSTDKFLVELFSKISDELVFIVNGCSWVEQQTIVLRYLWDNTGRDVTVVQHGGDSDEEVVVQHSHGIDQLVKRLEQKLQTPGSVALRTGTQGSFREQLMDAVGKSLANVVDNLGSRFGKASTSISLTYHDSAIRIFNDDERKKDVPLIAAPEHDVDPLNMNVYEVVVNGSEGACRERVAELELPGAMRGDLSLRFVHSNYRLKVQDLTHDFDLPFDENWNFEDDQNFRLEDGILTLTHKTCSDS